MQINKQIKNTFFFFFTFFVFSIAQAQVKIGENPLEINPGSLLELESIDKGILFPRVHLINTTTWGLVGNIPSAGMFVYNKSTKAEGFLGTDEFPSTNDGTGLYYWNGLGWVAVGLKSTVSNQLVGATLITTVNGVKSIPLDLSPLIGTGSGTGFFSTSGNILSSNVNGISQTATIVSKNELSLLNGILSSSVNGVSSTIALNLATTNDLTSVQNILTSNV
ncbi:MAG: hypothetical protein K2Q03_07840, partial [Sphingobacteriaceae bacterium]|nr:hypothetical protein [Sphingobacteriaceae bacterium]